MSGLFGLAIHPDLGQILDPGPLCSSLSGCVAGLCIPLLSGVSGEVELEEAGFQEKL